MSFTTINKSTDYFNTVLYSGANKSVTGVGFQPDWCWIKQRNTASSALFDAVRGATKFLESNSANAEVTDATTLTAFGSDGFTLGADSSGYVGGSSQATVAWNWKANGQGSSNTDGSINTTYTSANTTSGFSIIKYTGNGSNGATVGHGLGSVPAMIAVKNLGGTDSWQVYHKNSNATPEDYILQFNTNGAPVDNNTFWNDTAPTSSVFSIGTDNGVNQSSANYIAYCFAEKTGFSKFGSYIGNGNANGTFVYTGFKPAFVMIKRTDTTGDWGIFDNKREGYNDETNRLKANSSDAEEDDNFMDILSNGFKLRLTSSSINASGGTFIFMAFAAAPLVGSNNIPANAR